MLYNVGAGPGSFVINYIKYENIFKHLANINKKAQQINMHANKRKRL